MPVLSFEWGDLYLLLQQLLETSFHLMVLQGSSKGSRVFSNASSPDAAEAENQHHLVRKLFIFTNTNLHENNINLNHGYTCGGVFT